MRKPRPRYPKMKDLSVVMRFLAAVPVDMPLSTGWRESEKGTPNFRVNGWTNGISWAVDIYAGQYYIVRVGDRLTEESTNIQAVLLYLHRMLGMKRVLDSSVERLKEITRENLKKHKTGDLE